MALHLTPIYLTEERKYFIQGSPISIMVSLMVTMNLEKPQGSLVEEKLRFLLVMPTIFLGPIFM